MNFDPVSYAAGRKAGGSGTPAPGPELTDLDLVAFGNAPELPAEGKTDPANYEAIAEAINTAKARGNAVTLEDVTITQNTTTTAPAGKAFKRVVTNVPSGSQNRVQTITGTLENPFGNLNYSDLCAAITSNNATVYLQIEPESDDPEQQGEVDQFLSVLITSGAKLYGNFFNSVDLPIPFLHFSFFAGDAIVILYVEDDTSGGASADFVGATIHFVDGGEINIPETQSTIMTVIWHELPTQGGD